MKNIWKYIISVVVGLVIGILINLPSCNKEVDPEIVKVEVHDTITIEKERIKWKTNPVEVLRIDTFYITKSGDTITIPDIPITKSTYEDTIKTDSTSTEIKINYSGFNASIDNIYLKHNYYNEKEIIVKEPKKIGLVWFVGLGAGYGGHGSINTGTFGHGPQIGIVAGVGIGNRIK